jgi:hypothetical protein
MPQRGQGSVYHPPKIGLEQLPKIFDRYFLELAIYTYTSIVHPCIEAAELVLGYAADSLDITLVADIRLHVHGFAPLLTYLFL